MRLWKTIKNYPVVDGWHTDPDGIKVVKLGYGVKLGDRAKIGNWAQIGDRAKIGDGAQIGYRAKIGDEAQIGDCFPVMALTGKWVMNPYLPGQVRLGCYRGDYAALRSRTQDDWDEHGYSAAHVETILKTLDYFEAIEHLVFVTEVAQ